jgi:hypothetical protein
MNRALVTLGATALLTASAFAQADVIIKKRAQEIRDQNNVRQGVTSPSRPAQAAPATAPTAAAQSSPTPVQQSVARLRVDLTALKGQPKVTAEQKQQVANDLIGLAHGTGKPSQATAAKLADSLTAAYAAQPLAEKDLNRLLSNLAAVLNPAKIQPAQMQAIQADIQAIFQANGTDRKDALKITDQVKAVGAEVK